jgi:hypothetical protein
VLSNFGWILPGRLAGMAYPERDAGRALATAGVGAVLSLTEHAPVDALADDGLVVRHEPIVDFEAPSPAVLARCVGFVRERWAAGQRLCTAWWPRTGTVLAVPRPRAWTDAAIGPRARAARVDRDVGAGGVRARVCPRGRRRGERHPTALSRGGRGGWAGDRPLPRAGRRRRRPAEATISSRCRAARAEVVVDFTTPAVVAANAPHPRRLPRRDRHDRLRRRRLDDLDARAAGKGLLVAPNFAVGCS